MVVLSSGCVVVVGPVVTVEIVSHALLLIAVGVVVRGNVRSPLVDQVSGGNEVVES